MEIFQHLIQICHQIILRLHSREKVSINLTMKKSLSRQRRRASTQQKAAIRDKYREGERGEGGEPKHEVASSVEGQPQGGRRKPEWHADLVPGPLDLEG